jgi:hypothetical protein
MRALLLLALSGVAGADNSAGGGGRLQPTLRAVIAHDAIVELRLMSPDGKILWKHHLATPIAPINTEAVAAYQKDPRASLTSINPPVQAQLWRADSIVLWLWERLLVLDRKDGHLLFDDRLIAVGFGELVFEEADITLEHTDSKVTRRAFNGRFLIEVGPRLVVDNGPSVVVVDTAAWKRVGDFMFPDVFRRDHFDVGDVGITVHTIK